MIKLLSDLLFAERRELKYVNTTADLAVSGHEGMWVIPDPNQAGGGYAIRPTGPAALAFPIWNESFRHEAGMVSGSFSGTRGYTGFTNDVGLTKKVTVLTGHFRALTDWFTGTPAIGDRLDVTSDGRLTTGTSAPVAVCTKAAAAITYLGQSYTVIEFETI